ncbi:hypothetical protein COT50_03550 [candidate division WWE3 bacterium CG08_land_8_20_14_0_20_41_10]|uniref:Uncharacterized protein n=1 Tax=candidate division WWE3 bacterium CG08_land_8_20_14_0_20_41_10 TaxID=1975085 RepID=A0A2H0XDE2_UNCKA|nr:MAG: hypothetical protein COT50_03550 [candidate division WWE3 bacterium CG08_land_8_20_14_0_20_41_10]
MLYTQTQVKQITLQEFQHNLLNVLTNIVQERKPYIITIMDFPAVSFKLEAQELSDLSRNKSIDVLKKLANPLAGDQEYEANQRAWRRSIIEKTVGSLGPDSSYEIDQRNHRRAVFEETSGAIKDTKQLDKEIKARNISETAASKRLAKW